MSKRKEARIIGLDQAENVLGPVRFVRFPIVREFRFYENPGEELGHCVDLAIESEALNPNYRLVLSFTGVGRLTVEFVGGQEARVSGLEIINISGQQWEGLKWKVTDYENSLMEFYSKTAELVSFAEVTG